MSVLHPRSQVLVVAITAALALVAALAFGLPGAGASALGAAE